MFYLHHEKTAGWKCRACDNPRKWVSTKWKENPFGLVMRSVTNVMVFDTVIPPGYSIGLCSVIGLIVIMIGLIPR